MGLGIEQRSVAKAAIFITGESIVIFTSTILFILGYGAYEGSLAETTVPLSKAISFSLLCQASIYFCGLYNNVLRFGMFEQALGLVQAIAIAMAILVISSLVTGHTIDPLVMVLWFVILLVSTFSWRFFIRKMSATDLFCQKAILLGADQSAREIYNCAMPEKDQTGSGRIDSGLKIIAVASSEDATCQFQIDPGTAYIHIQDSNQLIEIAKQHKTRHIIVCKSLLERMSANQAYELKHHGFRLYDAAAVLESICGRRNPDDIDPNRVIFSKSFQRSFHRFFKRTGDIVISLILLVLLSPLMIVVLGGILLGRKVQAIKQHPCLGLRKEQFTCFLFNNLAHPSNQNFQFKRIQALPQLWNVLKGDMSLVGPSPIGSDQANMISCDWPIFDERFTVRPGITGWAQVNCGHDCLEHSVKQAIGYDLFYLKHMSLFLDIVVLCRAMRFYAPGVNFVKGIS